MNLFAWTATAVTVVAGLAGARVRWRNWGALPTDMRLVLPGDELIPEPAGVVTRGVPIEARLHPGTPIGGVRLIALIWPAGPSLRFVGS